MIVKYLQPQLENIKNKCYKRNIYEKTTMTDKQKEAIMLAVELHRNNTIDKDALWLLIEAIIPQEQSNDGNRIVTTLLTEGEYTVQMGCTALSYNDGTKVKVERITLRQ